MLLPRIVYKVYKYAEYLNIKIHNSERHVAMNSPGNTLPCSDTLILWFLALSGAALESCTVVAASMS